MISLQNPLESDSQEVKPGRFTLKAASNQLFVKAIPGGERFVERLDFCLVIDIGGEGCFSDCFAFGK